MKYSPLVMIELKHSFYDRGECPDFALVPNPSTATLLNKHRCLFKTNAYGLTVYVPVDNQQPLIPFVENTRLSFDLILRTAEFPLFTGQRLELSNPSGVQLFQAGAIVNLEHGLVTPTEANQPFLSIAIKRDFNQIKTIPNADEIRFFAKPVLWFYYLVTNQSNVDQFAIVDVGPENLKTTWKRREPLAGDGIHTQLAKKYPETAILCFASDQTLVCQESCSKHLQLKLGGHTIFERLPSPCYRNYFHVEEKTGSKPADAIYEIVKYLTDTTLIKG